jgi:hypothetical protein
MCMHEKCVYVHACMDAAADYLIPTISSRPIYACITHKPARQDLMDTRRADLMPNTAPHHTHSQAFRVKRT